MMLHEPATPGDRRDVVLIVDDTPANLAYLSDALDEGGYRVLVAIDGPTALERLQLVTPDVILLDAMMPGLDGFETCRRIKANPATSGIPVIFMTALLDTEYVVRGFSEGAIDYVTKPVCQLEVIARISAHVSRSRMLYKAQRSIEACGKAGATVDRDGNFTWQSRRAREWLEAYGSEGGVIVQERLRQWLQGVVSGRFAHSEAGAHLCITHGDGRLYIHYAGDIPGGECLILLDEQRADAAARRLAERCRLTTREAEVLNWLAGGKANREIAEILGMSPKTVNKHLERVYMKLGVENRAAAVAMAIQALGAPSAARLLAN